MTDSVNFPIYMLKREEPIKKAMLQENLSALSISEEL